MSRLNRRNMDKPTISAEMPQKHKKLRIVLIVVLLALGATLIATSVADFLTVDPGWSTISVSLKDSCSGDFVFQYYLGASGKAPNLEQRQVTSIYSQAAGEAYQIFHTEQLWDNVHNVAYLNAHPNETVQVPEALYRAFRLLENTRCLYLAPIYGRYVGMFMSEGDWVAETYDPNKNPAAATFFSEVLAFTNDEAAVKLELLENNQVRLCVSESYLQYAQTQEITAFIDFYWMKNAFIADYLADVLISAGYRNGNLSSFDGFVRNLDNTDLSYRLNIFDRVGNDRYSAAAMEYKKVGAFVALRNYPTSNLAVGQYYKWADGTFTSCHIDPATGLSKSACNDLLGYSRTLSCSEILVAMLPHYVKDQWDSTSADTLKTQGVEIVYCENHEIFASDSGVTFVNLYKDDKVTYKKH